MLSILKVGGLALLFCFNQGECDAMPNLRILVAEELGGSPYKEEILKTIECESGFNPLIQSQHKDPSGPNGQEDSWGLVQINLPAHPSITREQAQNWKFSLEFMKQNFEAGNQSMWTCWKINHDLTYGR
jgi:hypothetical protein